jgi:hypothetical protein
MMKRISIFKLSIFTLIYIFLAACGFSNAQPKNANDSDVFGEYFQDDSVGLKFRKILNYGFMNGSIERGDLYVRMEQEKTGSSVVITLSKKDYSNNSLEEIFNDQDPLGPGISSAISHTKIDDLDAIFLQINDAEGVETAYITKFPSNRALVIVGASTYDNWDSFLIVFKKFLSTIESYPPVKTD